MKWLLINLQIICLMDYNIVYMPHTGFIVFSQNEERKKHVTFVSAKIFKVYIFEGVGQVLSLPRNHYK